MQDRYKDFSLEEAMRLAGTKTGRQLLQMLRSEHGQAMQAAAETAKAGDIEKTRQALSAFLSDPKTKALLQQLQEEGHGRTGR